MADLALIRKFVDHLPLCQAMGMRLVEGDELVMELPYSEKLIGDPESGTLHGGAISTLLDTVCGSVVVTHPENKGASATVDLRIDYMRPSKAGRNVFATAEVYQTTRHIAFVRGVAWDDDAEKPIALATAIFSFAKKGAR